MHFLLWRLPFMHAIKLFVYYWFRIIICICQRFIKYVLQLISLSDEGYLPLNQCSVAIFLFYTSIPESYCSGWLEVRWTWYWTKQLRVGTCNNIKLHLHFSDDTSDRSLLSFEYILPYGILVLFSSLVCHTFLWCSTLTRLLSFIVRCYFFLIYELAKELSIHS